MSELRFQVLRVEKDPEAPNLYLRRRLAYAPDLESIGCALATLTEENQISGADQLGIYDSESRTWVLNPYARAVA